MILPRYARKWTDSPSDQDVWRLMSCSYLPLKGISIPYFVSRFVDPSLAFADGWYVITWACSMSLNDPLTLE